MFDLHPIRAVYVAVFGVAGLACFLSVFRTDRIDDGGIRRGLSGLLVLSGAWAGAHVGRLLAPAPALKVAFYLAGLLVGFGTVFAWLYFCSAYAGHSYHREPAYRRLAGLLFAVVTLAKLTNPVHGQYFATSFAETPFPHLVITQLPLHWVVTALAYALAAVGFYMLFELFIEVEYDTTPLGFLVFLTGMPVILDLVGYLRADIFIELNYEPIGVALFAVGVLYVTEETFLAVPQLGRRQLVEEFDEAVLFLDADHTLLDCNGTARDRFPDIAAGVGGPVGEALPGLGDPVAAEGEVLTADAGQAGRRYYLVGVTELTAGGSVVGRAVVLTDVTEVERQRRELRRQNEQLDAFAAAVTHELRNTLGVISGNLELATEELEAGESVPVRERLETITATTERMARIVGDLTTLARLSQTVTDPGDLDFGTAVREAWQRNGTELTGVALDVDGGGSFEAEEGRFEELVRNVALIAGHRDASSVRFALENGGFTVSMDGAPIAVGDPGDVFEYGTAVPDSRTGMLFANVQSLARAHGWTVDLAPDAGDTLSLRVSGVVTEGGRP